jgi:hypothetical protein
MAAGVRDSRVEEPRAVPVGVFGLTEGTVAEPRSATI